MTTCTNAGTLELLGPGRAAAPFRNEKIDRTFGRARRGTPDPSSEATEWLHRFRDGGGDRAAERLVEHLYPTVAKVLHRRLPPQLAVEDVAQQVFLKMFRKLDQYRGGAPVEHWVSKIAVNTCLNAIRSQQSRPEVRVADLPPAEALVLDQLRTADPGPDSADTVAARDLVERLLEQLSAKERLVVQLVDIEGHTSQEAAAVLGSTAVAVRVRLSRARARMRKALQSLNPGDIQ